MKLKATFAAILLATIAAPVAAENISVAAGRCAAYHFVRNNISQAELAMRHAENRGRMQVAANNWLDLAKKDPDLAGKQAAFSCIFTLKMKL